MGEASRIATSRKASAVAASLAVVVALVGLTARDRDPAPAGRAEPSDAAGANGVDPTAPASTKASAANQPQDAIPKTEPPGFDVVRVSPDGAALVAGRAAPGARVTIAANETDLAVVEADRDGNFVAIFRTEPSAAPRALTLDAEAPDGTRTASEEVVVLLPSAAGPAPADQTEPDTVPSFEPASGAADDPQPPEAATPEAATTEAAGPEIAATAILRTDSVDVVSSVPLDPTERQVTLASISYADQGEVTLAGVGTAGAQLRAYVDGDLAREAAVGPDGRWSLDLRDVERGLYNLRIDQLAPDGRVASRVETPFQRDYPTSPRPRPGGGPGLSITVQPGSNLWTIARTHYGSGVLYAQIFTANRELIRDPNLIYPGQVLALPEAEEAN